MEYYSAFKQNEIRSFAGTCMDLDSAIMSEVSQTVKVKYISFISEIQKEIQINFLQNRKRLTFLENEFMIVRGKGQLRT